MKVSWKKMNACDRSATVAGVDGITLLLNEAVAVAEAAATAVAVIVVVWPSFC